MIPIPQAQALIHQRHHAGELVIVVGHCQVEYSGRAASKLTEGDRVVIVKADGTFLVHQGKGMTAINYQGPGAKLHAHVQDDALVLESHGKTPRNGPAERIQAVFSRVDFAQGFPLSDDQSLSVTGTEEDLARLLMHEPDRIEPGLIPLKQESARRHGEIDILARDKDGKLVAVEVKRRTAELAAVTQLRRYVEELAKRKDETVRGILAAPDISSNAKKMLQEWGYTFAKIEYDSRTHDKPEIKKVEKQQRGLGDFG